MGDFAFGFLGGAVLVAAGTLPDLWRLRREFVALREESRARSREYAKLIRALVACGAMPMRHLRTAKALEVSDG